MGLLFFHFSSCDCCAHCARKSVGVGVSKQHTLYKAANAGTEAVDSTADCVKIVDYTALIRTLE